MQQPAFGVDKDYEKWLAHVVRREGWRVAAYIDLDDLIQEGMIALFDARSYYKDSGRTEGHIRSTAKRIFLLRVHTMANTRTRDPAQIAMANFRTDEDDGIELDRFMPAQQEEQSFALKLARAPLRIREVLALFASDADCKRLRVPYRERLDGSRETMNERLCRLAGFDPERVDLVKELRAFLSEPA